MTNTAISVAIAPFLAALAAFLLKNYVRLPLQRHLKDGRIKRLLLYKIRDY